jgi:hypothetical protein
MDAGSTTVTHAFSAAQQAELQRTLEQSRDICGLCFGLLIGPLANGRESAIAAHAQLPDAARAVLIAVDPAARTIEVVTGARLVTRLDDRTCELAVLAMRSSFEAGDLVRGIHDGAILMAQHARNPQVRHLDEPA